MQSFNLGSEGAKKLAARMGKKGVYSYIILISLALLGLAGLRFYSLYLEHELIVLNQQIDELQQKNLLLSQRLLSLMAPDRVVYYASGSLGMTKDLGIDTTIRVAAVSRDEKSPFTASIPLITEKRGILKLLNPFASAREERKDQF